MISCVSYRIHLDYDDLKSFIFYVY